MARRGQLLTVRAETYAEDSVGVSSQRLQIAVTQAIPVVPLESAWVLFRGLGSEVHRSA